MCTVSIVARRSGYLLAMNRDEQRTRARALPPKHFLSHGRSVISPSEPGGGTWISLNDARVTFALINWYSIKARVTGLPRSRGEIVNAVNSRTSPDEAAQILGQLPLKRINPFRLIGVFPATKQIVEWRWDLKTLSRKNHSWTTRQFISSGFDEPRAQRVRGKTFRHALRAKTSGTLDWLRRLHRSHAPETGPFSTCMHRADAQTVSCTEILVSASRAQMRYYDGPPCEAAISEPLMQTNPRRLKIRKVACNSAQ
jgi:hypothetical protein